MRKLAYVQGPFPTGLTNSWIFWWMSKVPVFPQNLVLPEPFSSSHHVRAPPLTLPREKVGVQGYQGKAQAMKEAFWQNSPRPPAQALEPCPLQA